MISEIPHYNGTLDLKFLNLQRVSPMTQKATGLSLEEMRVKAM